MKKKILAVLVAVGFTFGLAPFAGFKVAAIGAMSPTETANLNVIDISHYDNVYDWPTLAKNFNAVYIKATEGTTFIDKQAQNSANSAHSAGMSFGFYAFMSPNGDSTYGAQQADYFYDQIKNYPYNCYPVLDVEDEPGNPGNPMSKYPTSTIIAEIKSFADEFKRLSGQDIMIYIQQSYIDTYLNDPSLANYKLWVAETDVSNPKDTNLRHHYDMWQYTDSATNVPGTTGNSSGNSDLDIATSNIFLGITNVDSPNAGGTYYTDIPVYGWAVSKSGVASVNIYDGNNKLTSLSDLGDRPDVQKNINTKNQYQNAEHSGYSYTIPAGTLSSGPHTITVESVSNDGSTCRESRQITVASANPIIDIDSPQPGTTYYGDIPVYGWAVSKTGVSSVNIYDGTNKLTSVTSLGDRPDVQKNVNPDNRYNDGEHSGYGYTIPSGTLSSGQHTITVESVSKNGTTCRESRQITVASANPIIDVDSPNAGGTYYHDIPVYGWAVSQYGVSTVNIYDGNNKLATISSLSDRPDVQKNVNSDNRYNDGEHSGYGYTIPSGTLSSGQHVITVESVSKNGTTCRESRTITVASANPIVDVDSPQSGATYYGDIPVYGWAVSQYGVSTVNIYDGNNRLATISSLSDRPDVQKNVNQNNWYSDGEHSGYGYTIPSGTLSSGKHVITVESVSKNGTTCRESRQITVALANPIIDVDSPQSGATYYGDIPVYGWAVSQYGVSTVNIYDGTRKLTSFSSLGDRPDVQKNVNPDNRYNDGEHSGYGYTIPSGTLSPGQHTITVESVSKNGTTCRESRQITVALANPIIDVDSPQSGATYYGDIPVYGWAVSQYGVSTVNIYDGTRKLTSFSSLGDRPDVQKNVNPDNRYNDGEHSGYGYTIPSGTLSSGKHTITVESVSKNGTTCRESRQITVAR